MFTSLVHSVKVNGVQAVKLQEGPQKSTIKALYKKSTQMEYKSCSGPLKKPHDIFL